jgi:integrase
MATIRKRGDMQWQAIVKRKGVGLTSKTFTTRRDAEDWAKLAEADMLRGAYIKRADAERTMVAEIVDRFATEFALHHYRARADNREAWRFQAARIRAGLGTLSLAVLDARAIARYRDDRLKQVGEATVRKELYLLSKIIGFAENECGIMLPTGNPVERVRKPAESAGRDRRLSADEFVVLLDQCARSRSPWLRPAVLLAVETAARQGELLALRWVDVDLSRRVAMLHQTKNGEARALPLSSAALAVLAVLPRAIDGRVLPVRRMTLYSAFAAACDRAGIEDYTFHDLRHEALSRLAERGDLSVLELAAVSGHKTLQMLKRYTHLKAENLAKKLG